MRIWGRLSLGVRFLWQNWSRIDLHDVLSASERLVLLLRLGQHEEAEAAHEEALRETEAAMAAEDELLASAEDEADEADEGVAEPATDEPADAPEEE